MLGIPRCIVSTCTESVLVEYDVHLLACKQIILQYIKMRDTFRDILISYKLYLKALLRVKSSTLYANEPAAPLPPHTCIIIKIYVWYILYASIDTWTVVSAI